MKRSKNKKKLAKTYPISTQALGAARSMTLADGLKFAGNYLQVHDFSKAEFVLEQLIKIDDNNVDFWFLLLDSCRDKLDVEKADELAASLLDRFPHNVRVLRFLSVYSRYKSENDEALDLLHKALAQLPKDILLNRDLMELYISLGRKEKALSICKRLLVLDPGNGAAHWGMVKLLSGQLGADEVLSLESAVKKAPRDQLDRAFQLFSLASCYAKINAENYQQALIEANNYVDKTCSYDRAEYAAYSDKLYKFTTMHAERAAKTHILEDANAWAPVFIAALPRSGTTLLEQMLASCNECVGVGESNAFQSSVWSYTSKFRKHPFISTQMEGKNLSAALQLLASNYERHPLIAKAKNNGFRAVDKSIENSLYLGPILMTYPKARVINLQRHPLDIILSCYQQFFTQGHQYSFNLEELAHVYLQTREDMRRWSDIFPDQILTIRYEDLVSSREPVMREVLKFLGVEWDESCLEHHKHVTAISTASEVQVRQAVYADSVAKWKSCQELLQPAIDVLGKDSLNY